MYLHLYYTYVIAIIFKLYEYLLCYSSFIHVVFNKYTEY